MAKRWRSRALLSLIVAFFAFQAWGEGRSDEGRRSSKNCSKYMQAGKNSTVVSLAKERARRGETRPNQPRSTPARVLDFQSQASRQFQRDHELDQPGLNGLDYEELLNHESFQSAASESDIRFVFTSAASLAEALEKGQWHADPQLRSVNDNVYILALKSDLNETALKGQEPWSFHSLNNFSDFYGVAEGKGFAPWYIIFSFVQNLRSGLDEEKFGQQADHMPPFQSRRWQKTFLLGGAQEKALNLLRSWITVHEYEVQLKEELLQFVRSRENIGQSDLENLRSWMLSRLQSALPMNFVYTQSFVEDTQEVMQAPTVESEENSVSAAPYLPNKSDFELVALSPLLTQQMLGENQIIYLFAEGSGLEEAMSGGSHWYPYPWVPSVGHRLFVLVAKEDLANIRPAGSQGGYSYSQVIKEVGVRSYTEVPFAKHLIMTKTLIESARESLNWSLEESGEPTLNDSIGRPKNFNFIRKETAQESLSAYLINWEPEHDKEAELKEALTAFLGDPSTDLSSLSLYELREQMHQIMRSVLGASSNLHSTFLQSSAHLIDEDR